MMLKKITIFIFLISSSIILAQTTHDVTVQNFSFSPQSLTITVGDIVKWTNISGTHNVLANDNSFTSGNPAPAIWTYTHTFTSAGNFPYYCEPHLSMGMTGTIIVQNPVSVEDEFVVDQFKLEQNYPNPFNPSTRISYTVPTTTVVNLKVFDIIGNEVLTLVNKEQPAGYYQIDFDASKLSGGVYFYQLKANNFVDIKKMILMK